MGIVIVVASDPGGRYSIGWESLGEEFRLVVSASFSWKVM